MTKNVKINKNTKEKIKFCSMKINFYKEMITNTILSVQKYKSMDIITASDMNTCIINLETLYNQLNIIESNLGKLYDYLSNYGNIHVQ